jgi:protein-L-isoaspartate O-methyltransferase
VENVQVYANDLETVFVCAGLQIGRGSGYSAAICAICAICAAPLQHNLTLFLTPLAVLLV